MSENETEGTVMSLSTHVSVEQHDDTEWLSVIEGHARESFKNKYGFDSTNQHWVFEDEHTVEDLETGEDITMPPMWMLLTEGIAP